MRAAAATMCTLPEEAVPERCSLLHASFALASTLVHLSMLACAFFEMPQQRLVSSFRAVYGTESCLCFAGLEARG